MPSMKYVGMHKIDKNAIYCKTCVQFLVRYIDNYTIKAFNVDSDCVK